MENNEHIEQLQDSLKKYLNTRYELAVLKASDKVSLISSITASAIIVCVLVMLFVTFLSIAAGFYLSHVLGSHCLGFLAVACFYLVAGLIIFAARKSIIINPVRNKIIKEMFDEN